MADLADVASWGLAAAALAGTVYQIASAVLVRRFVATPPAGSAAGRPPVTLLKPLCGDEPGLEANLRDFCRQDYPAYQVVFGLHDSADPARAVAERLQAAMPGCDIAVAVGSGPPQSGNPKVANLLDMMPAARHDVLVLSDSDISVGPDYLASVMDTLARPGVGVATCLYCGEAADGLWSRLGAMGINHGFLPSVLVGRALGRTDGCFGATIAVRRDTLAAIGGFESLREQLADDYLLGAAVRAGGQEIGLAHTLPRSVVFEPDLPGLFAHEVRWGRTLASIDRMGYIASAVTQAIPLGLLATAANPAMWPVALAALAGRLWAVRGHERALGLPRQPAWLVVARDLLSLAVQVTALAGRTVLWRGQRFRIGPKGTLVPFGESSKS